MFKRIASDPLPLLPPPAPLPGWITVGMRNDAVPPGHHVYLFHVVPAQPERPFCFEESVGGGHTSGGGAVQLGLLELDSWGDWRDHLVKAGCPWVADLIDERSSEDVVSVLAAIIERVVATR